MRRELVHSFPSRGIKVFRWHEPPDECTPSMNGYLVVRGKEQQVTYDAWAIEFLQFVLNLKGKSE